jgi:2-polyprenyl-3-methyl-5-hydroxy-6-metoxy-1,4-benzoquinol methylase
MSDRAALRERLYQAYASQHAGCSGGAAATLIYRRDIRPLLPRPSTRSVVDIGCGQGDLVRLLLADGYAAEGIDVSPEQVALAQATGLSQVHLGDYRKILVERRCQLGAVTATDLLEHLTKDEVLDTLDRVVEALAPGGVFVARVPNAISPLGGHIRYGDFTHESSYTARSVKQIVAAVTVQACPPVAHGIMSAARVAVWKPVSAWYKIALAAETGVLRGHVVTQNLTFVAQKTDEGS